MKFIAKAVISIGLTTFLVGCGGGTGIDGESMAGDKGPRAAIEDQLSMPGFHPSLPPGHPPITREKRSLPPGHPAVPQGVCPRGGLASEPWGAWGDDLNDDPPEVISI